MHNLSPAALLPYRRKAERRFRAFGLAAVWLGFVVMALLLGQIVTSAWPAFWQTRLLIPVTLEAEKLAEGDYAGLAKEGLKNHFPEVTERLEQRALTRLLSTNAGRELEAFVQANPQADAASFSVWLTASGEANALYKKGLNPQGNASASFLATLEAQERIETVFDWGFFTKADSREPEQAGVAGAVAGSLLTVLACLLAAFPIGVLSAIYLEEFAPRHWLVDAVEVNINNLAAVPSIIFGLLGLAVYLSLFGLPRSSALAGGLTLALMILPTLIITTRAAIRSVPMPLREAALGLGATRLQVILHHILPLSLPGILTGAILGTARALGETAPLLMIGMVAFVADIPAGFTDPATTLPVQIYLWSDSPEQGFAARTAAAILVLLGVMGLLNALAIFMRARYEKRW